MKVDFTQFWDNDFFKKFVEFKNNLYCEDKNYHPESLEYFQSFIGPNSAFTKYNIWMAWLISDESGIVGRVIASKRTDQFFQNKFIPFGHFEASNAEASKKLLDLVEQWTKAHGTHLKMRGPIQGNVFNSSRFTLWTKEYFYSEPYHKGFYHLYFKNSGLAVSQHWVSIRYSRLNMLVAMLLFYKKLLTSKLHKNIYNLREIDFENWDRDFQIMYELLMDSYSTMPDVEQLSFEEFKAFNYDLKKIIRPKDGIFLEDDGKAVGFFVLVNDQYQWMVRAYRWRLKHEFLGIFAQVILGIRIKLGIGRTLLLYLGKTLKDSKYQKLAPFYTRKCLDDGRLTSSCDRLYLVF